MGKKPDKTVELVNQLIRMFPLLNEDGRKPTDWIGYSNSRALDHKAGLPHMTYDEVGDLVQKFVSDKKRERSLRSIKVEHHSPSVKVSAAGNHMKNYLRAWRDNTDWTVHLTKGEPSLDYHKKSGRKAAWCTVRSSPLAAMRALGNIGYPNLSELSSKDISHKAWHRQPFVIGAFSKDEYHGVENILSFQTVSIAKKSPGFELLWGWSAYAKRGEQEFIATHKDMERAHSLLVRELLRTMERK